MDRNKILQDLKDYKNRALAKHGVLKLGVFGSIAREKTNEFSDLDIVVDLKNQDLFTLIGIKQELEEQLKIKVDIVSYRPKMDSFLRDRIDKEAIYV